MLFCKRAFTGHFKPSYRRVCGMCLFSILRAAVETLGREGPEGQNLIIIQTLHLMSR